MQEQFLILRSPSNSSRVARRATTYQPRGFYKTALKQQAVIARSAGSFAGPSVGSLDLFIIFTGQRERSVLTNVVLQGAGVVKLLSNYYVHYHREKNRRLFSCMIPSQP